ncbi:MAG: DUF2905 domain-containing protein [Niabella sp.]
MQQTGKFILIAGIIIAIIGIIFILWGNKLNFIGRLPGDIRIEKEHFKFYFPITTLILISLVINLIIWFIKRF